MKNNLTKYLGFFITLSLIVLVYNFVFNNSQASYNKNKAITYSFEVVKEEGNWLYEVYKDDILYIRQEYLPAVYGRQRFTSQKDAKQVAQLVVKKLQQQQLPLITKEELIANKITFQQI